MIIQMELHRIRGGSKEDLETKAYNIGVGISLGNKWFSIENILELTKWALEHTKEYTVIYMADSIHAINLEVRKKISAEKAKEQALDMGTMLMAQIKKAVSETFSVKDQERIHFAHWDDIADSTYQKKVRYLYNLYETDLSFRNAIELIVRDYVAKEERKFKEEDIRKLSTYLLEELPEHMNRVSAGAFVYDAFAYPSDSGTVQFVEKVQKGEIFPEIKENIIDTKPKVFLVVS
jgi:tRNA-dependent cyclodipeptide synthase